MRRNIAKVSALIMAATTTMSPMMPAATTVAWADEVVAATNPADDANFGKVDELKEVKALWDDVDWNADAVTVTVEYYLTGYAAKKDVTVPVTFDFLANQKHGEGITAIATVKIGDYTKSFTTPVPENTTHYSVYEHHYVEVTAWGQYNEKKEWEEDKDLTGPTCTSGAVKKTWLKCDADGCTNPDKPNSEKLETVSATGHAYSEWEVDYSANKKCEIVNVKTENGKVVFDKNGNAEVLDPTLEAKYPIVRTCKRGDAEERDIKTIAPSNLKEVKTFIPGDNTVLVNGEIVLKDHTKEGKYKIQYEYYDGNNKLVGEKSKTEDATIEAGSHTWSKTYFVDTTYKYDGTHTVQSLINAKKLTVKTDAKTGDQYVVNNDCSKDFTVRYVQKCTDPFNNEKTDAINEETAKVETVEHSGAHSFKVVVDKVTSVDKDSHVVSRHNECTECGAVEALEDVKESHTKSKVAIKENYVAPTCGKAGSVDLVTYCTDCDYVFETNHVVLNATGEHEKWTDPEIELDGEYIIAGKDAVAVVAHQYCAECGLERFKDADGDAVLSVSVNDKKVPVSKDTTKEATYANKKGKLTVETKGVTESKYECCSDTVKVVATYTVDGKTTKKEFDVPYYKSEAAFYNRTKHVAGTPVTEEREDGTYKVTYCKYGCGTEMSAEKIETPEPEKTLGQVEGLKATAKADGQVVVSWDALEGADGYLVVAINGKVRGQQIGYTAGTSFVDKDANAKDYNYYWVIPYFKNADGKVVKGQLTGYVYAMKQTEFAAVAESTDKGVALTWDAVEGASKYIVKAKAASEKVATELKKVSGTSYVDATASADEYTFYWVFPVYTNAAGKEVVGNASTYAFGMTTK